MFSSPFGRICPVAEPVRKCHADIEVIGPLGVYRGGIETQNLTPAGTSISSVPMLGRNTQYPVPTNKQASSGNFNFFIYEDSRALDFWKSWSDVIYDVETDTVGLLDDVTGTAVLTMHGPDGTIRHRWRMIGCWPSNVVPDGFDSQDDGNPATLAVTLEVMAIS